MTHHPNTPASRTDLAVEWLRNNYQDYPNIASLCDAMREALAASRTEEAVPSVASGVESGAMAKPAAWLHYVGKKPSLRRVDFSAQPSAIEKSSGWKTIPLAPLAAPVAALAAREQEAASEDEIHMAWRGALKACGVSDADRDAITEVVRSMLPTPARSPATVAQPVAGRIWIELSEKEQVACLSGFKGAHGSTPDFGFAPDRAWLEGYAAAQPCPSQGCGGDGGEVPDALELIGWEYRHLDTANTPNRWSEWTRCRARNAHTSTDEDFAKEIQHYIDTGSNYELRTIYAAALSGLEHVGKEGDK